MQKIMRKNMAIIQRKNVYWSQFERNIDEISKEFQAWISSKLWNNWKKNLEFTC